MAAVGPTVRRGAAAAAMLLAGATTIAGCALFPGLAESSAPPSATPAPTAEILVPNDLSSGSTKRSVTAGAVTASIDYWSTLDIGAWTPSATKPLTLNLSTTVTPDDGQEVYLQRASLVASPGGVPGGADALAPQVDQSTVAPGYTVLDPYSYSQTFSVGSLPAEATYVTLQFTYEFLVQTTPTSTQYAKQTGTDTLTVALVDAD